MLASKRILLIIGGGIAAYKSLDLIRRLRERGASVTPVLTSAGEEFVTPLSVSALAGQKAVPRSVRSDGRGRNGPYRTVPFRRSDRRGPGDRRSDGQDGAGSRQ